MKYYIIAGEASGDLHGSNLMKALQKEDADAQFRFWGGDEMQGVAGKPVKHIKDLAFMGFIEVIANLRTILGNIKLCKNDILDFQPDVIILIDYPGFNLRIAEFAKKHNLRVVYYISPQVWAWKQSRVHKIKKIVDEMYVILPFEKSFYKRFDYTVSFVGHPLLDAIETYSPPSKEAFIEKHDLEDKKILALLPGSRKQEIQIKLPIMLKAAAHFPELQPVVAAAPSTDVALYKNVDPKIKVVRGATYPLLSHAHAALVTSGTATLETALFEVPQVVCYKGSWISYQIAKRLIKVNYISLVNLIMDREVVKELIQSELNEKNLKVELEKILDTQRSRILSDYKELKDKLGKGGASALVAKSIVEKSSVTQ